MARFSVIIPTYNRREKVLRAISSVLAQTFRDFDLFVVDDGSTDGTQEAIARAWPDSSIHLIRLSGNSGQHVARNRAIRESKSEWLVFLDSDDWFAETRLAVLNERISRSPSESFIYCNATLTRDGKTTGLMFSPDRALPEGELPGWYAVGEEFAPYVTSTVALKRELFEEVGYFREDMRILEDAELYARMFQSGCRVGAIKESHVFREMHPGQITHDHIRGFKESMMAYRSGGAPDDVYKAQRAKVARQTAIYLLKSGRPLDARKFINEERVPGVGLRWLTYVPASLILFIKNLSGKVLSASRTAE